MQKKEICVDVYGDFAMFTPPHSKVERISYPVMTPSAARNILCSIYCKPIEFYYEITGIEIMKSIKTIQIKKNETKAKADASKVISDPDYFIDNDIHNTQRLSTYLRDVYYRIHANIVLRDDAPKEERINLNGIVAQFNKRVQSGKCFAQPYLGTKECMCFFQEPDMSLSPLDLNMACGIMLYDVFDITNNKPLDTRKSSLNLCAKPSFFNAVIQNGVMRIPEWGSPEILRISGV